LLSESEIKIKVEKLLLKMSLEEKIGQLVYIDTRNKNYDEEYKAGKIGVAACVMDPEEINRIQRLTVEESRLGIPVLVGNDVIHGYRTIFPIPLAEACSWDITLMEKTAAVAADESAANGTMLIYAPMLDIARDARWGRIAEGAGEDTFLGSVIARARVKGFQRYHEETGTATIACAKHFIAYGAAEGGRDYNSVDMSEKTLREVYLPPFKVAVDTGVETVMTSFNDFNGLPVTANKFLIQDILRNELGFDGVVVSDYDAIHELVIHGVAEDSGEACRKAFEAGTDMDMNAGIYTEYLSELVKKGKTSEKMIDDSVRRVLVLKYKIGLFDHPYINIEKARTAVLKKENIDLALDAARKSIVLLKNNNKLLPLGKDIESIALIGPLADNRQEPLGCWACDGKPDEVVTVLQGLYSRIQENTSIMYVKGCNIEDRLSENIDEAVEAAKCCQVAVVVVGESAEMSGEFHCRSSLELPGMQEELIKAVCATGTPVVVVLMNGRPLSIPWVEANVQAILEAWHPGIQGGNAIADILLGYTNPSAKLVVTFPRDVGQIPIYYNHKNTGKPPFEGSLEKKAPVSNYLDLHHTPLYPFGYGLSYSNFKYENLNIRDRKVKLGERVMLSADVANYGDTDGDEIVQLYVQDINASMTRPVKELKGFKKISLKSGEKKTVEFELPIKQLGFYNNKMKYLTEPGIFHVWIGWDSAQGLEGSFEVIS